MRVNLIPIGSSRGVRLPKPILDLCGAKTGFELEIQGRILILHPLHPRAGWDDAFGRTPRNKTEADPWTW